eukprot:5139780-Amphidinium_carterae.1
MPCQQWKHRPDAAGLVTPQRCNQPLDAFSCHAQVCCKFLHTRRHNAVRDLVQHYAQEAGYTALAEQFALAATSTSITTAGDATPARRGHERADLHLVSPSGQDKYLDVRVTT